MTGLPIESILFLIGMLTSYCGAVIIPRQAETRDKAILLLYLCTIFGWMMMLIAAVTYDYGQGKAWIESPFSLCLGLTVIVVSAESISHKFPRPKRQ